MGTRGRERMEGGGGGSDWAVGGEIAHLVVGELVETGVMVGVRVHAGDDVDVAEEEAWLDHEVNGLEVVIVVVSAEVGWHHHACSCGIVACQSIWTPRVEVVILRVLARVP